MKETKKLSANNREARDTHTHTHDTRVKCSQVAEAVAEGEDGTKDPAFTAAETQLSHLPSVKHIHRRTAAELQHNTGVQHTTHVRNTTHKRWKTK